MELLCKKLRGSSILILLPLMTIIITLSEFGLAQIYLMKGMVHFKKIVQKKVLESSIVHMYSPFLDELFLANSCNEELDQRMHKIINNDYYLWVYRCYESKNNQFKIKYGSNLF